MIHKAKKSLGQNFLKSNIALKKIIEAGEILSDDIILEIGPGKGVLTEKLLEKSNCVIAVEKDRNLFQLLQEKFKKEIENKKLILAEDDILKFNIKQIIFEQDYKIIANIPYNITGAILKKFLTEKNQPNTMVLMVQHEVAKRIIANDKKESILSVSVKAYGEPKMIMKVPARYFSPAPKVDSAIIAIKNISRKLFTSPQPSPYKGEGEYINEEKFWEIIHAGFAHKRKKLSSNLKKCVRQDLTQDLGNKRAEDLSLLNWINIAKN
ncbi:MAG: 16S rRNA (adenine(1518)-N(6)/adenine(1519)-N(6))-dimethyltransferase RsmA [Candidatus Paceibacterota bacterium]|jgi:16S rRNA (adenine1518-N6/adenine1519-N6)-dimethyltransferase